MAKTSPFGKKTGKSIIFIDGIGNKPFPNGWFFYVLPALYKFEYGLNVDCNGLYDLIQCSIGKSNIIRISLMILG